MCMVGRGQRQQEGTKAQVGVGVDAESIWAPVVTREHGEELR